MPQRAPILSALALGGLVLLGGCAVRPSAGPDAPRSTVRYELDSPYGNFLAARHARIDNDHETAARFYLRALSEEPDNSVLAQGAFMSLLSAGKPAEAVQIAPALRALNPNDHLPRIAMAAEAMLNRNYDAALRISTEGGTGPVQSAFNPMIAAWAEIGKGRGTEAVAALARLERNPLFGGVAEHLKPFLLEAAGQTKEAEAAYRAGIEKGNVGARQLDGLARLLERTGRRDEARRLIAQQLPLAPDNSLLLAASKRLAAPAASGPIAPVISTPAEGLAEAMLAAATVFGRNDAGELTETHLQIALYLRPDFEDARLLLADIYEQRKQWARALAVYAAIQPSSPYYQTAQLRVAWCANELDRHDDAVRILRRLARDNPEDPKPLLTLADLYRQMENWSDAAREYSAAIDRIKTIEPRHWSIFFSRGIALERAKQWDKAEPDMLKALQLQPEQPMVMNYLGYTWVDLHKDIEKGTDLIRRAVALRPNDGAIVDSLGWAYFRLGRYEEAVAQLERAVELKGGDPVITDHLGDAYWKVGRYEEARFQWRRALGLKPEDDLTKVIQKKIDQGLGPLTTSK